MFNRNTDQFDNIFNDCLERILVKGESIEACLVQYPQQADDLKPLLETALAARKALDIKPRPEFRARARYQFHSALQEAAAKKQRRPFSWQLRWVTTASLALALLLSGGGIVAAASTSMPDSPLYQVKLATEQIQLFLTPATEDKAELYAKLADRRVTEIVNMAQAGNVSLVELTTERLDNHLSMIASISAPRVSGGFLSEGGAEAFITLTVTKTVTATVGGVGTLPEGTSESLTLTITTTVGVADTTTPGITTETAIKSGVSSQQPCINDKDFTCQLRQDSESNIAALYEALESAPEEVKPALMQAIAVLENGYNNALNAIANEATG
jgi:hypothetical protein